MKAEQKRIENELADFERNLDKGESGTINPRLKHNVAPEAGLPKEPQCTGGHTNHARPAILNKYLRT